MTNRLRGRQARSPGGDKGGVIFRVSTLAVDASTVDGERWTAQPGKNRSSDNHRVQRVGRRVQSDIRRVQSLGRPVQSLRRTPQTDSGAMQSRRSEELGGGTESDGERLESPGTPPSADQASSERSRQPVKSAVGRGVTDGRRHGTSGETAKSALHHVRAQKQASRCFPLASLAAPAGRLPVVHRTLDRGMWGHSI